jgi:CheY-like chemotaxis protein
MICSSTTTAVDVNSAQKLPALLAVELALAPREHKKVLIADDSLVFLTALSMKLRSQGYQVVVCQQGARIISLARSEKPDVILLDVNFPPDVPNGGEESWDGLLVLEWLRRLDETKATPVIVITGEDAARYRPLSFAAGAVGFFEKPVQPGALLAAIQLALR